MADNDNSQWLRQYLSRRAALRAAILGASIPGAIYLAKSVNSADAADDNIYIPGAPNFLELGHGWPGKEANAGKITYRQWSDALDIVGAGTDPGYRKVKIWDDLYIQGLLNLRAYIVDPEVPRTWTAFLYAKDVDGQSKPFWKDATGTAQPLVSRSATLIVAASDASPRSKLGADFVCDGTADEEEIQAAIDALPAVGGTDEQPIGGGKVVLTEGTFNCSTGFDLDGEVLTLEGQGREETILEFTCAGPCFTIQRTADTRSRVTLRDFAIKGDGTNTTYGIHLRGDDPVDPGKLAAGNCHFESLQITNMTAAGVRGESGNHENYFERIYIRGFDNGFDMYGNNNTYVGCMALNVSGDMGSGAAFRSGETQAAYFGCFALLYDKGFKIDNYAHGVSYHGCSAEKCNSGYQFTGLDSPPEGCSVFGGEVYDSDHNTDAQFIISYGDGIVVSGVHIYQSDSNVSMSIGANANDTLILGGKFEDTTPVSDSGTRTRIINLNGYVTENSGTGTIAQGRTSVTVAHGLDVTPTSVSVTPQANPGSGGVWVSAVNGTNITVNRAGSTGALSFRWEAKKL
jgi:hypothetical protein